MSVKEQKAYLISREEKKRYKNIEKETAAIKSVYEAGKLTGIKINVEWNRSRTWGSNPSAECWVSFINKEGHGDSLYLKSGPVSGCGYDKLSTAVANVLNKINPLLKLLYNFKNTELGRKAPRSNRDSLGYGSGYGILPQFEGGVGVSCYPEIFKKIGFEFKQVASGNNFDVFTIEKFNKK